MLYKLQSDQVSLDIVKRLHPALLDLIFGHLSATECNSASLVSKAWLNYLRNRAPWGLLKCACSQIAHRVNETSCSNSLVSFTLTCDTDRWPDTAMSLLDGAPNLESLVLLFEKQRACGVESVCKHLGERKRCTKLIQLAVRGKPCDLTDNGILALTQGCPNLLHLEVHPTSLVTDLGLQAIARHWPNLRTLCLLNCTGITLGDGSSVAVSCLLRDCHRLCHLRLAIGQGIKPAFFTTLGRGVTHLRQLRLEFIEGDQGFDAWDDQDGLDGLSGCSNLSSLTLQDCGKPGPNSFASLIAHLTELRHVRLKFSDQCDAISDDLLTALAEHCPLLETLRLAACSQITDSGLINLGSCQNLRRLTLSGLCSSSSGSSDIGVVNGHHGNQFGVTSSCLASTLASCASLSRVRIAFTAGRGVNAGDFIQRLKQSSGIFDLRLNAVVNIDNQCYSSLASKFPSLQRLRLNSA